MLGLIWAQSRPHPGVPAIVGRGGTLPWRVPEDLARFRALTLGRPVVMGRRTWDSLPPRLRPLPGRENIVLTAQPEWRAEGATVVGSVAAAERAIDTRDAWITGGATVWAAFLQRADRIELTEVDIDLGPVRPDDVLAPVAGHGWDRTDEPWQLSATGLSYRFSTLTRR